MKMRCDTIAYVSGIADSDSVSPGSNPGSPAKFFNDLALGKDGNFGTFGIRRTHESRHSSQEIPEHG